MTRSRPTALESLNPMCKVSRCASLWTAPARRWLTSAMVATVKDAGTQCSTQTPLVAQLPWQRTSYYRTMHLGHQWRRQRQLCRIVWMALGASGCGEDLCFSLIWDARVDWPHGTMSGNDRKSMGIGCCDPLVFLIIQTKYTYFSILYFTFL